MAAFRHMIAQYARSLVGQDDVGKHPSLHDYARDWIAAPVNRHCIAKNPVMAKAVPTAPPGGTQSPLLATPGRLAGVFRGDPCTGEVMSSFLARMREAQAAIATPIDLWALRLERVRGKIDCDGLERVSSQTLLDLLEIPQRSRKAGIPAPR